MGIPRILPTAPVLPDTGRGTGEGSQQDTGRDDGGDRGGNPFQDDVYEGGISSPCPFNLADCIAECGIASFELESRPDSKTTWQ